MAAKTATATLVRRATLGDVPAVASLFNGYRMFYGQPSDEAKCAAYLAERLALDQSVLFVAQDAGASAATAATAAAASGTQQDGVALSGFVHLYPLFSSVRLRRTWLLNDLFVTEESRRGGVGAALMEAAEGFARDTGAAQIALETGESNAPAQRLYEERGWALERDTRHYYLDL